MTEVMFISKAAIIKSNQEPADKTVLWFDTNVNKLKYWNPNSNQWEEVGDMFKVEYLIYEKDESGNSIYARNDDEKVFNYINYTKVKEFKLPNDFPSNVTLRLQFKLKTVTDGRAYAKIYRNGSAVTGAYSTNQTSYQTFTVEVAGWNPGDYVQLYCQTAAGENGYVKDFRILGNFVRKITVTL